MNSAWLVAPCSDFVEGKGLLIEICSKNSSGFNKDSLHLSCQPHTILTSDKGDQLYHIAINTRTIKPMKTHPYIKAFQMYTQRGLLQDFNTYDITTVGNVIFPSIILEESGSRTITKRSDISALLGKLHREKFLTV